MKAVFIGNSSIILDKVASTNSYLAELLIEQNLPEGTAVTAYEQGGGRGQRGTQWESEPGKNITLSLLLK
ncbi:MAG TPA: biotin--[acetyl-CoA-carboxylase] ligase, partial [Bacteroidia bacterium]|nr:biotin--[acetyl-CoA-carboxylase] ligase [Bacteroidia bacterium]